MWIWSPNRNPIRLVERDQIWEKQETIGECIKNVPVSRHAHNFCYNFFYGLFWFWVFFVFDFSFFYFCKVIIDQILYARTGSFLRNATYFWLDLSFLILIISIFHDYFHNVCFVSILMFVTLYYMISCTIEKLHLVCVVYQCANWLKVCTYRCIIHEKIC